MVIVCSAPGRAGIIGNPTDMYGGSVISCSIRERVSVRIESASELELETLGQRNVIRNGDDLELRGDYFDVVRAILAYLRAPDLRCRIRYSSSIPFKAGVAGSTALTVALACGIMKHRGITHHLYRLAEIARYIELNHLKVVCGYQDAYMCTFGGLNYMDFRSKQFYREAEAELYGTVEPLTNYVPELPFVLAHTGVQHSSGAVHKPIRERWLEGDREVVQAYDEIGRLAREGKKALLQQDWERLGTLMNENHAIQRDLGGSGEANERFIRVALEHGALGAKLAGAGDGGTIIALNPTPDKMIEGLRSAGAELIFYLHPGLGVQVSEVEEARTDLPAESVELHDLSHAPES